jgi:hypothetical protein
MVKLTGQAQVRESIAKRDEEAAAEREAMEEMFRQLSAARRAVAGLRSEQSLIPAITDGSQASLI